MDRSKCIEAVTALQKYLTKKTGDVEETNGSLNLLEDDEDTGSKYLQLIVTTRKYVSDHKNLKPKFVKVPHSLYENSEEKPSICIIVKDPQRAFKDVLQDDEAPTKELVTRVVGVSKFKGKFKPYESRRQLASGYDLFLADDRVITTLPKLLGKTFYSSNSKLPLPVTVLDKNTKEPSAIRTKGSIDKILHSTWFTLDASTMIVVKVGLNSFDAKDVADNVEAVVEYITKSVIKNGFEGVRALHIKSASSPSLPIYLSEKIYSDEDVVEKRDEKPSEQEKKRKREAKEPKLTKLEQALAEVIDEEDFANFTKNKLTKKTSKPAAAAPKAKAETETATASSEAPSKKKVKMAKK
ncbi:Cic1p [Sugiyamaella lignohabitans]|uniref:Cic1p n=1 Tax=Sugiyamaella lignohabitans TaxID=796027 RepID=A0A167DT91_9ASCO|nr:Cic1p [Sugiyamaella lignohabitans]ANB13269.1 Cic1p [Sugiyamaella lignohabitans]